MFPSSRPVTTSQRLPEEVSVQMPRASPRTRTSICKYAKLTSYTFSPSKICLHYKYVPSLTLWTELIESSESARAHVKCESSRANQAVRKGNERALAGDLARSLSDWICSIGPLWHLSALYYLTSHVGEPTNQQRTIPLFPLDASPRMSPSTSDDKLIVEWTPWAL